MSTVRLGALHFAGQGRLGRLGQVSLLAIGVALATPGAFAQQAQDGDDIVVVTGTATGTEYEKIGNSLTVVSGELIEDQGYTYVPDVLRQVPGLAVNRTGGPGGLTAVRIRGAEANHTLVLLDGIDVGSPDNGETDLSTLLSSDIERIEVLRGPQSGLYGSNALAGVVNLISRRNINGHYVHLGAEAGEMNTYLLQANGGVGDGDSYVSGGVASYSTDGYDVSPTTTAAGVPSVGVGGREGDEEGSQNITAYLRAGKALSSTFRVDGIARYLDADTDTDGQAFNFPISGQTYDDATSSSTKQFLVGGSGTLTLMDGKWITQLSGSYVDEERRSNFTNFPFVLGPPAPTPAALAAVTLDPFGADAKRTKFTLQSTYEFGAPDFVSYITGFVETRDEEYHDPFSSPSRTESRDMLGIGAQYRAEIASQFYLSATARHDDNDKFEDADTYSVAGSWVISNSGSRPHASFGTGVTNPTFFEQFGFNPGTFTGNPNLVPEEAEGWDIGWEQHLLGEKLVFDITYFESTLKHEIATSFASTPPFFSTPVNSPDESDRKGWEASVQWEPMENVSLAGTYTDLDATEPAGLEVRRPRDQASLDATWRIGGGPFQLNAGISRNGEQTDTDFSTFAPRTVDGFTLMRIGASWQLNDQVELYGRIENATDEEYEEVIGFRSAPRAAYIGIRFKDGPARR